MPSLSSLTRYLGNERAIANVQAVLDARTREEWIVAGVALRLEATSREPDQHVHSSRDAAA